MPDAIRSQAISDLKVGQIYTNDDIKRVFQVSGQGGMRKSNINNCLVLFVVHNERNPYADKWSDDGVLHYTGMGLSGDQSFEYMQNKTLANSKNNGVDLHLFESNSPNEYIYSGQVELAGEPYYDRQPDHNSNERQVVKFPLVRKQT